MMLEQPRLKLPSMAPSLVSVGHSGPIGKTLSPVVDFALTLPGVDPQEIALMGVSLGGYLAPRAAAFEKRISALIANDGVYDYGVANLGPIPSKERLLKQPPEQKRLRSLTAG